MQSYKICQPRIVYEVLNTEVIAIDFNTGNYYALLYTAKQIWSLLEQQLPLDRIAQLISDHYQRDFDGVLADVQQFIGELLDHGLVEAAGTPGSPSEPAIDSEGLEYIPPKLMTYVDVQDLLLIDPIHKVTDAGWPHKL